MTQGGDVSSLTGIEKRKLERAFGMETGYVLNFSNFTFSDFFNDFFGIDIFGEKYAFRSGSKANRMRAFWNTESDYLVGQVLGVIFDNWTEFKGYNDPPERSDECVQIARRLRESAPPPDLLALVPSDDDKSFETLARSVSDSIQRNEPESGLDRLHTFTLKYFRRLCEQRGIDTPRDKPLHSLVGEYVKVLRTGREIDSVMTERILKTSISVFDAFNAVRNERSLAHDNEMLSREEALLILSHVTSSIRFVQSIEAKAAARILRIDDYGPGDVRVEIDDSGGIPIVQHGDTLEVALERLPQDVRGSARTCLRMDRVIWNEEVGALRSMIAGQSQEPSQETPVRDP